MHMVALSGLCFLLWFFSGKTQTCVPESIDSQINKVMVGLLGPTNQSLTEHFQSKINNLKIMKISTSPMMEYFSVY